MVRTLVNGNLDVNHRITSQNAFAHGFLNALINSGNEAAWNMTTHNLVDKLVACVWVWLNTQPAVAVLAGTASLLLVSTLSTCNSTDRLAIWNAECNFMRRNTSSLLKALEKNSYLCLTNCRHNGLSGVLIALNLKSWIGVGSLLQECKEFTLGTALIRLNSRAIQRVGEPKCSSLNLAGNRKRVTRHSLEFWNYYDIASCGNADVRRLFSTHAIQVRKALRLASTRVNKLGTCRNSTRQDFHKRKLAVL